MATSATSVPQEAQPPQQALVIPPATPLADEQSDTDVADWALGGGLVLLLGGAGLYMLSRRRSDVADQPLARDEWVEPARPMAYVSDIEGPAPIVNDILPNDELQLTEPVYGGAPVAAPETRPMVRSASMTRAEPLETGDLASRREHMIAEAPSAENPFLTRKNRLRRANFIMSRSGFNGPASEQVAARADTSAEAAVRSPQQVTYRFQSGVYRPPVFKPRTA